MLLKLLQEFFGALIPVVKEGGEWRFSKESMTGLVAATLAILRFFGVDLGLDAEQLSTAFVALLGLYAQFYRQRASKEKAEA